MNATLRSLTLAALALLGLSCGDDESLGVNNVSPRGSVGGVVLDSATMKPMQGVKVVVVAGGKVYPTSESAATDATGFFSVDGVPCGDLIVQLTPTDAAVHKGVSITAAMSNSAGDFPLANATLSLGPLGLIPLTKAATAFSAQLVSADGAPAQAGIKAYLRASVEWIDFQTGTAVAKGSTVVEATSDSSGMLNFVGAPDFAKLAGHVSTASGGVSDTVRIQIPPFDTNKDGTMDFLGKEVTFSVNSLNGAIPTIVLSSAKGPTKLSIDAATIAALAGKTGKRVMSTANGPIYITFNMPVRQDLTEVRVYDELGKLLGAAPSKSVTGNVLTLSFSSLKSLAEYNLSLRAVGEADGVQVQGDFGAPFFTPGQTTALTAKLTRDAATTSKIYVAFSEPVGTGVADTSLSGSNSVVFLDYDLNSSGKIGDGPGEKGNATSTIALTINETDPPGPAGKSGVSSYWYFSIPVDSTGNPVAPASTGVEIIFSASGATVERANAQQAPDVKGLSLP